MENQKQYVQYLPKVQTYIDALEHQDLWWTTVAMVGKINNENIDPQLLESIVETQKEFQQLRNLMIQALISRYLNQANSELMLKAQAAIDIIIRNLFERTADVGFLATDDDLIEFMSCENPSDENIEFIHHRIQEYVAKYSVYDDVVLVDTQGHVRAKLNGKNPVTHSQDPLIAEALSTSEPYIEVYRQSSLFPHKTKSLIYAKRIEKTQGQHTETVGVLCLSFEFDEEMASIFPILSAEEQGFKLALLNENGQAIASNHRDLKVGQRIADVQPMEQPENHRNELRYLTRTHGYQGFMGLPWVSYIQANFEDAFKNQTEEQLGVHIEPDSPIYLTELEETNLKVSTLLLIVILNGKITSLKKDVKSFLPVLDSFQTISRDIQEIFADFIEHIHQVLVETIESKVQFSATLAIEIMDRNLYERANDCRWWALNSTFRRHLSKHQSGQNLSPSEQQEMTHILEYINSLYTVYTNILIYDRNGKILSVSNARESHLVGTMMPRKQDISNCLNLKDTQAYTVSDFHASELYDNRYTYIYHAAIKSWETLDYNVGGIALVFDSEPEFDAMLQDSRPTYRTKAVDDASFCVFSDRNGGVIASSSDDFAIGSMLELPTSLRQAKTGESGTLAMDLGDQTYIVGYKMSEGYREYKNQDGYENEVLSLVFTGIQ